MTNNSAGETRELESDRQLEARIVKALRARQGRASVSDVVVDTGIPTIEAERMLRQLIGKYPCHLEVTEEGDLLFEFEPALTPRHRKGRFSRWLKAFADKMWRGFRLFMKALIMIVMVAYFILFVVLIVAALVAGSSRQSSSSSRRYGRRTSFGGGGDFFFWYWIFGRPSYRQNRRHWHNPTFSRYRTASPSKDPRPFYLKVFSFVLGPEPGDVEELNDEASLLAYIRSQGAAISAAQIATRTGWSLQKAEDFAARMVARYEGDLEVTDEGVIVYSFPSLLLTVGGRADKEVSAFWERWEMPTPLTGNTGAANTLIVFLNSFNIFASLIAPSFVFTRLAIEPTGLALFGLSWFPLGFSLLVFALPVIRKLFRVNPENRRRRNRNLRRALFKEVYRNALAGGDSLVDPADAAVRAREMVPDEARQRPYETDEVRNALDQVFVDLDGEIPTDHLDEADLMDYRRLAYEFKAARKVGRRLKEERRDVGEVTFSTRHEVSQDKPAKSAKKARARAAKQKRKR